MNIVIEHLNSVGAAFVTVALPMLIQSSVLILILLAAEFLMRKRVRAVFRYWIWMLVLVKLALPASLSSPFSLGSFFGERLTHVETRALGVEAMPQRERAEAAPATLPAFRDTSAIRVYRDAPAPALAASDPAPILTEPPGSAGSSLSWQAAAFASWLAVVIAMALLLLQRAVLVRGLVARAKEADGFMKDTLDCCRKAMGVKRKVGLKVSASATSPAVCGLSRPVILIPHGLASSLGAGQLRAVMFHELAHIRRGDLWVSLAQTVLQIVYFYNPLLWAANSMIRRAREQAVDEAVLVVMGEKARHYPQTLVNVARLSFERPALSLRLIGVVESKNALAGRIRHILNRPTPRTAKLGIFGLLAIVLAAAILLPMARAARKDERDWTRPTERWKGRPVKKTSLESWFGGWRNLPFEIAAAEEQAVKRCRKLVVYWPRAANDETSKKLLEDIRVDLEGMVREMPEFFYGEFLLAMWHLEHGDAPESARLLKAAYEHAPVILVQKYQNQDGEPIEGAKIQGFEIECNRVKKRYLDPSLVLKFRNLVTDDDGCIYVPVYDTVYRRYLAASPEGHNIAYPTLGWFSSRGKLGLMPVAKSNSADGGLYEKARPSRNLKIKVGPTAFNVHTVVRWDRRGNPAFEDGKGEQIMELGLKTPDYTKQAPWMDIANIYMNPDSAEYDVLEMRVFDHRTRALLRAEDNSGFGYDIRNTIVQLRSVGELLPDSVDIWFRVLHNPPKGPVWRINAQKGVSAALDNGSLSLREMKPGRWNYTARSISGQTARIQWTKQSDARGCTAVFDFANVRRGLFGGDEKYQICAVAADGRRSVPDSPHFIGIVSGETQIIKFDLPPDQISRFEVRPFNGRDTFYFDGVRLPDVRREPLEPPPVIDIPVDGVRTEFTSNALDPLGVKVKVLPGERAVGTSAGARRADVTLAREPFEGGDTRTTVIYEILGLHLKGCSLSLLDPQDKPITPGPRMRMNIGSAGGIGRQTVGYQVFDIPIRQIAGVRLGVSHDVAGGKDIGLGKGGSDVKSPRPFNATLANGVTVELVGLCKEPGDGARWWKPDGRDMPVPSYRARKSNPPMGAIPTQYTFLAKATGGQDVAMKMRVYEGFGFSTQTAGDGTALCYVKHPNPADTYHKDAFERGPVEIGVAQGQWIKARGPYGDGFKIPRSYSLYSHDEIAVQPPQRESRSPEMTTQFWATASSHDYEYKMVCKLKDGGTAEIMPPAYRKLNTIETGNLKNSRLETSPFEIDKPMDEIVDYELFYRKFEYGRFSSVAFRPDVKTDVQVKPEPTQPGYSATLANGSTVAVRQSDSVPSPGTPGRESDRAQRLLSRSDTLNVPIIAHDVKLNFADPTARDGSFHSKQSVAFVLNFMELKDLPETVVLGHFGVGQTPWGLSFEGDRLIINNGTSGRQIGSEPWPKDELEFNKVVVLPVRYGATEYKCPVHVELTRQKDIPPIGSYWFCAYLSGRLPWGAGGRMFEIVNLDQQMEFRALGDRQDKMDAVLGIDTNGDGKIDAAEDGGERFAVYDTFRIGPGYYRVREIDPYLPRVLFQAVSPQSVADARATGEHLWPEPVNGVQCRLRANRAVWRAGEVPTFKIDLRSRQERRLPRGPAQDQFEVQLDGRWYRHAGTVDLRSFVDPSLVTLREGIHLALFDSTWRARPDGPAMNLAPGRHTVRVAFLIEDETPSVRALSNTVEIEIILDDPDSRRESDGKLELPDV